MKTTILEALGILSDIHYAPSECGYHFWYGTLDGVQYPINLDRQKAYPHVRVKPSVLRKDPGGGSNFFRYNSELYTDWDFILQQIQIHGRGEWLGVQRELMLRDIEMLRRQLRLGWIVADGGMVHPTLGFAQLCITSHFPE